MSRLERADSRRRWREMTDLVNEWDPIGLLAMGCPPDEYDCVVGDVLRALERGDGAAQLSDFLAAHLAEHFGAEPRDPGPFATRAVAWYALRWPGSHV